MRDATLAPQVFSPTPVPAVVIRTLGRALLVAVVCTSAVVLPAHAVPALDVTVAGNPLGADDVVVATDPAVRANATAAVDAVAVAVDDTARRPVASNETLSLDEETHEPRVVARADTTAAATGTVTRDTSPPRASYTSPVTTNRTRLPGEITVDRANVTVAADLFDDSGIDRVVVRRRYDYRFAGDRETARTTHRIDDPGEAFAQRVVLGSGENHLTVRLRDDHGNIRVHETTVTVVDDTPPSIVVRRVERTDSGRIRVVGVVRDNVKVDTLSVSAGDTLGERVPVVQTDLEPEADRLIVPFRTTVAAGRATETVTLTATDVDGNRRRTTVPLDYEERADPTIRVRAVAPDYEDDTVRVVAAVDGGATTRVVVETVADGVVALRTVYDGPPTDRVTVDERLPLAGPETRVRIRVTDATLTEQVRTVAVAPPDTPGPSTATPTASPTATPRPSPAVRSPRRTEGDAPGFRVIHALAAALAVAFVYAARP